MNQYEIANAAEKIDGYFLPSPTKGHGDEAEFVRAKNECVDALKLQAHHLAMLTFDQFLTLTKRKP